jgi:Protein of unknown function (DUF3800)
MEAFLDESGTHAGSKIIALAGYVISAEALPRLQHSWLNALEGHSLEELHMKDFVPPHGKHSQWNEEKKRGLLKTLIGLIHEHSLVGIGAAVEIDEFIATTQAFAHSKSPDIVESPYEWCFRHCATQAAAWVDKAERPGLISYTLDEGCSTRGRIYAHHELSREDRSLRDKYRLGPMSFADSKRNPALQCADLLAYEMYKEADRQLSGAARPSRGSFLALWRDHDRLVTISPDAIKRQLQRGMQINWVMVEHLPPREKFQVMCYALRHMKENNREVLFGMNPAMRNVYNACLALGEMGMRLDELPRELLPPDDPEWFRSRIDPLPKEEND